MNPAFEYQVPTPSHVEHITAVRKALDEACTVILQHVPQCAERTLAIRKLEEGSMWANKAIVFDGIHYLDGAQPRR